MGRTGLVIPSLHTLGRLWIGESRLGVEADPLNQVSQDTVSEGEPLARPTPI